MLGKLSRRKLFLTLGSSLIAVSFLLLGAVALAQSGSDQAEHNIAQLAGKGSDSAVVAIVNGQLITRREIDIQQALSTAAYMSDSAGRPMVGLSRETLLDNDIDEVLLAQAAQRSGTVVTDADVSLAIRSGIVDPLASSHTPDQVKRMMQDEFKAAGIDVSNVEKDSQVRADMKAFLLVQRYVGGSKSSRSDLLAQAKVNASIQKFIDVLNASH